MNYKVLVVLVALGAAAPLAQAAPPNPVVLIKTSLGPIEVQLFPAKAPRTVRNFLHYVRAGFYNGTVFHRVIPGFMIQGGGFTPALKEKATRAPIPNEADNGLKNVAGTLAMARTSDPNSATAQFFINTTTNPFLDFRNKSTAGWGYTVFGKVIHGMAVVRKIEAVPTQDLGPFQNLPVHAVLIERAEILKAKPAATPVHPHA